MTEVSDWRKPRPERQLTKQQIEEGVQRLVEQVCTAMRTGKINCERLDRLIYVGSRTEGQQIIFPLIGNPWGNNREVAERVVEALTRELGCTAYVVGPKDAEGDWRDLRFEVLVPRGKIVRGVVSKQ